MPILEGVLGPCVKSNLALSEPVRAKLTIKYIVRYINVHLINYSDKISLHANKQRSLLQICYTVIPTSYISAVSLRMNT